MRPKGLVMSDFQKQLNKTAKQLIQKANNRQQRRYIKINYNVAVLSIFGWQVAIPVLLSLLLGDLLDKFYPASFSWTLNLIIVGFVVGFTNAIIWLKRSYQVKKGNKNGRI